MRKTTAAFSAIALAAFALTGCAAAPGNDGADCAPRESSTTLASSAKVSGDLGSPKLDLDRPVRTSKLSYVDAIEGEGRAVAEETQSAIVTLALHNGASGEVLQQGVGLWSPESLSQQLPGVGEVLECVTAGSRVIASIPAASLPEGMAAQVGLQPGDSLVGVFDVHDVLHTSAEGRDVFNDASGLPTVVRAADGRPGVIIPDGDAPKDAVMQTLIEGEGDEVGDAVPLFNFTAVSWSDRSVTASNWGESVSSSTSGLPEQVVEAMKKAAIGSQLLVVVPGEDSDATAYVVDVLGVIPEELTQG
ncbi:hypothetical protein [Microbacterium sp.]|uniref:hypothetical protein n=1 Tax=Microbacterium sp. TaxID=51671 RepID=UPI002811EE81|nr:hypothetical protein [Microbacterium sp.]